MPGIQKQLTHLLMPQRFLLLGGSFLLLLAILGFILPSEWWTTAFTLDVGQSVGRMLVAVVAVIGARSIDIILQRRLCLIVGAVLLLFAVWGLLKSGEAPADVVFGLAYLGKVDSLLHLVLGVWGVIASFGLMSAFQRATAR